MTWKDYWVSLANQIVFLALWISAAFLDDDEKKMRRRVHALCWLGMGLLLLILKVLFYLEILIPIGAIP